MSSMTYISSKELYSRINQKARPQLADFLSMKQHGRILGQSSLPSEPRKDRGKAIDFVLAITENGMQNLFFVHSEVLSIERKRCESFGSTYIALDELQDLTGIAMYDPATHYVVAKNRSGRPKEPLTDEEKSFISELRRQGRGYNYIAKTLGKSNRIIIEYCREIGEALATRKYIEWDGSTP